MSQDKKTDFEPLIQAGLFTLGYLMAKDGLNAWPVAPLAKALKTAGTSCDYVDTILAMSAEKEAKS